MVKWLIPLAGVFVGVAIFVGGVFYGVYTVGVPTQDLTPEKAAQEEKDTKLSGSVMRAGLIVAAAGTAGLGLVLITQLTRRIPAHPPG